MRGDLGNLGIDFALDDGERFFEGGFDEGSARIIDAAGVGADMAEGDETGLLGGGGGFARAIEADHFARRAIDEGFAGVDGGAGMGELFQDAGMGFDVFDAMKAELVEGGIFDV